ncbi:hypothetical protein BGX23_010549 [Mortierella sp. AD031]|nr:hypothetical protein BGX23_010549 [Mortierella sp. AD031]
MQFKTLALAAVAVAAVSAQTFENNACTKCVFESFPKDESCAKLTPAQLTTLTSNFANGAVNAVGLAAAAQDPSIKACVCHWAGNAFKPDGTGAAGACFANGATTCNTTQIGEATSGIAPLTVVLGCTAGGNVTAPNATTPAGGKPSSTSTGAPGTTTTSKPSDALKLNMPYVLSVAALGLAALAGL